MDNCVVTTRYLLTKLKIRNTKKYLEDNILSHPDHPSLLCISDTLEQYSIDSLAVKVNEQRLEEFPLPCVIQFSSGGGIFHVLTEFSDNGVKYLDNKENPVVISKVEFLEKWTGICLLVETTESSAEPEIKKKLIKARRINFTKGTIAVLLSIWILTELSLSPEIENNSYLLGIAFIILKLVGLITGVILLWYEVDKYNPTLQNFCSGSGSKKINCNAVLESKYAKLLDGQLSLGLLSFAYFFGTFSLLVITKASYSSYILLSYLSLAVVPVIFASIYYQALVIKQWCKFCIMIQTVLLLEVYTVLTGSFYIGTLQYNDVFFLLAMLLLPILLWNWLKPILEELQEANLHKRELKKIKNNPNVFHGLLSKSRRIATRPEGLGISFENEKARYNVIKVCNPYCGPCAKAHPILDELVEKEKINLHVLFTESTDRHGKKAKPVGHFMAIDAEGNKEKTQKALDDWYLSENKHYETFAKKNPINGNLEEQNKKIAAMKKWCNTEKITHTPTIFINGHELPKQYSVEDLKEVLS